MDRKKLTRTAQLSDKGRTSLRFDADTWKQVDDIAAHAGMKWLDWARRAVQSRPDMSKAAAIRFALASEQAERHFAEATSRYAPGKVSLPALHPLVGQAYYRLDDEALQIELDAADITERDAAFTSFELITGFRSKSFGDPQQPFLCIRNLLRDQLHLFIVLDHEGE